MKLRGYPAEVNSIPVSSFGYRYCERKREKKIGVQESLFISTFSSELILHLFPIVSLVVLYRIVLTWTHLDSLLVGIWQQ